MRTALLLFLISFLILGCDARKPPEEVDQDLIYDEIPLYEESSSTPPYNHTKFQSVIDQSKLQYPDEDNISQGNFANFKASYFYADRNTTLHFTTKKEENTYKTRSELRQMNEWSTSNADGNYWVARLKCLKPKVGITSYTWMQVHGTSDTYNYPLLRLLWDRSRDGTYDHLWAVIIVTDSSTDKIYDWVDMGARPEGFFDAEVHIKDNLMTIMIDRKVITTRDVSYWEDVSNYYKAGVYVDKYDNGGEASVLFEELHFYDNPDDVVSPHH